MKPLNQYRCAGQYDDYNDYVCLNCHQHFNTDTPGKFCPECGTKWDGEFTKRNPRWPDQSYLKYDWRNPGYKSGEYGLFIQSDKPRIIVETGSWRVSKLSNFGFFSEPLLKPELVWHLATHTTIGSIGCTRADKTTCCGFSICYESYQRYCKEQRYDAVRIRLLVGTKSRIIKECCKKMDFGAMIEEQKRRDAMPMFSGMPTATGW